jgi:DNA replication protein DnaC
MNTEVDLLDVYLRELRLATFRQNHESFAADAAQHNHGATRFLLALAEAEVQQREANRRQRRLKEAKIPIHKTLSSFDFSAIPSLKVQRIRQLVQGAYLDKAEPILLVGNPGLGKSHVATALAISACQQMYRVRFYNAAALVNELILAHQEQRLSRFLVV